MLTNNVTLFRIIHKRSTISQCELSYRCIATGKTKEVGDLKVFSNVFSTKGGSFNHLFYGLFINILQ